MVANILRSDREKRDFSIVLAYLILTHSFSNVKFENVLPLRPLGAEEAAFETTSSEFTQKGLENIEVHTPVEEIMQWLTSFHFLRPASNDMFAYFLQGERSNDRDDLSLALLSQLPIAPVEPRQTMVDDEMIAFEAALRDVDGISLNDAQEDFAAGLSLAGAGADLPQVYGRFNSFDAYMSEVNAHNFPSFDVADGRNCLCIDGKPTVVVNDQNRFVLDLWSATEDNGVANKDDALLAACIAQSPCGDVVSNSLMNSTVVSTQSTPSLLPERTFEHLLAEVGSSNDFDYEGLKQFAYGINQTSADGSKAVASEARDQSVGWINQTNSLNEHNYAAAAPIFEDANEESQASLMTMLDMPRHEVNYVEPYSQLPQASDDESGVHSDDMVDYDPDQNAFGGYSTAMPRPEGVPLYTEYLSDDDYMRAQLNRASMQGTSTAALSTVDDFADLDECADEFDEEVPEEMREVFDSFTLPKSSSGSDYSGAKRSKSSRKRNVSDDATESSFNEADDDSMSQSVSASHMQALFNSFTGNLPYSDGDIIHSTWPRFEAMLKDRRLSAADVQVMKDVRRRGKNKIAAMNCRRRKQNRVDLLRDERTDLSEENERLTARLAQLREEERLYDIRLERALLSLSQNGYGNQH